MQFPRLRLISLRLCCLIRSPHADISLWLASNVCMHNYDLYTVQFSPYIGEWRLVTEAMTPLDLVPHDPLYCFPCLEQLRLSGCR